MSRSPDVKNIEELRVYWRWQIALRAAQAGRWRRLQIHEA